MKRVVQCPKCQAKLAVFDLGKPINQKCPKCKENFVVETAEAKGAEAAKEPTAETASAPVKPEVKTELTPEAKEETKTDVKLLLELKITRCDESNYQGCNRNLVLVAQ
jgi:phage FluMu protein Com